MMDTMHEKTHGGALMSSVGTYLKPRVPVSDGCDDVSMCEVVSELEDQLTKKALKDRPIIYVAKVNIMR